MILDCRFLDGEYLVAISCYNLTTEVEGADPLVRTTPTDVVPAEYYVGAVVGIGSNATSLWMWRRV